MRRHRKNGSALGIVPEGPRFIVVQPDSMMTLPGHAHDSFEPQAKEALSGFLQEIAAQAPR
jgi:hypothetical protein